MSHNIQSIDSGIIGFGLTEGTSNDTFAKGTWHGLPNFAVQEKEVQFEQAAKLLNWTVQAVPCFTANGTPTKGHCVEDSEGNIVHPNCGADYGFIQNSMLLNAASRLMAADEGLKLESALTIGGRSTVVLNLLFGEQVIAGDNSPTVMRVALLNYHGCGPFAAYSHHTRIVCQNTLTASRVNAGDIIKLRHTSGAADQLEVKVDKLHKFVADWRKELEDLGKLSSLKISEDMINNLLLEHFQVAKDDVSRTANRRRNKVDEVMNLFNTKADLVDLDKSAYRLLNAVTDYYDHHAEGRGEFKDDAGVNWMASIDGGNAEKKTAFQDRLFSLAGI